MLSMTTTSESLSPNLCAEADMNICLIKSHTLLHKNKKTPEDLKNYPRERNLLGAGVPARAMGFLTPGDGRGGEEWPSDGGAAWGAGSRLMG